MAGTRVSRSLSSPVGAACDTVAWSQCSPHSAVPATQRAPVKHYPGEWPWLPPKGTWTHGAPWALTEASRMNVHIIPGLPSVRLGRPGLPVWQATHAAPSTARSSSHPPQRARPVPHTPPRTPPHTPHPVGGTHYPTPPPMPSAPTCSPRLNLVTLMGSGADSVGASARVGGCFSTLMSTPLPRSSPMPGARACV